MTVQETSPVSGGGGSRDMVLRQSAPSARPAKPIRRLPAQKDWPLWAIIAVQGGILAGIILSWQAGADHGWIDGFFWSKPSAIFATLIPFFTKGDAWIDISFTFRSTIFGFLIGT